MKIHKTQILQLLNVAACLEYAQLERMIDLKQTTLDTILTQMHKAGKLFRRGDRIAASEKLMTEYNTSRCAAMWVFVDFIRRADYYTAGEFPAVVCFFADGAEYEIIQVEPGQEIMVNKAVSATVEPPNRLVVITDTEQIGKLHIPNTAAYCTVDENGQVRYYKAKRGEAT